MTETPTKIAALQDLGVLVTRPVQQAKNLCELIERAGGRALTFPVLAIEGRDADKQIKQQLEELPAQHLVLFISANAVQCGLNLIARLCERRELSWCHSTQEGSGYLPGGVRVAAIGRATARELKRQGIPVDIVPAQRFNSEALLALPEMQQVSGKNIMIFRGEGGRELIADTLRERGAEVDYCEVYRRKRPEADITQLLHRWGRGEIDVIIVTSAEGLHNLYDMVGKLGRTWLVKTPLLVVSEAMRDLATEYGILQVEVAHPDDEQLLQALSEFGRRSGRSDDLKERQ